MTSLYILISFVLLGLGSSEGMSVEKGFISRKLFENFWKMSVKSIEKTRSIKCLRRLFVAIL